MLRIRLVMAMVVGAAALGAGCASGDGVPEVVIRNEFPNRCLVQASFHGYTTGRPLGSNGADSLQVPVVTDYAYGVLTEPAQAAPGSECTVAAMSPGGTLVRSKAKHTSEAGGITRITLSPDTTDELGCQDPGYAEGVRWFARLAKACGGGAGGAGGSGGSGGNDDAGADDAAGNDDAAGD